MSKIISNREEFIELYNSYKIYSFTKLSDDIIREFFPYLPIEEMLVQGNLSQSIIDEFKTEIEIKVGIGNIEPIIATRNILSKYFYCIPVFELRHGKAPSITFEFKLYSYMVRFCIAPRMTIRFAHYDAVIISPEDLTERRIIGLINKLLLAYSDEF